MVMENNRAITYSIVIAEVEEGNLDALRMIMDIANVEATEAQRMIKSVPCTICTTNDLNEACTIIKELKLKGVIANMQSSDTCGKENKSDDAVARKKTTIIAEEKPKSKLLKRVFNFIEIAVIIFLIFALSTGKLNLVMMDLYASINGNDYANNPYIEMVLNHKPFNDGETYVEAFARSFDSNNWTYFKADNGQRIVQVVSYYKDIPDDKMIMQIAVTPQDREGTSFWIEPYAMKVSGQDLSNYEMNIVLAAIFKNDVANRIGELFFYSLFY